MISEKHVASSLAVRSGILVILAAFGVLGQDEVEFFSKETESLVLAGATVIGGIGAIVGRWRARQRLTFRRSA